jgi:hypothetical protein
MHPSVVAIGLGEARRHELDKFREPVALVEAESRSTLSREEAFSGLLAMARANNAFGHSRLCAWAFAGMTQDLLAGSERCTLVSHYSGQVRRGAT